MAGKFDPTTAEYRVRLNIVYRENVKQYAALASYDINGYPIGSTKELAVVLVESAENSNKAMLECASAALSIISEVTPKSNKKVSLDIVAPKYVFQVCENPKLKKNRETVVSIHNELARFEAKKFAIG